MSQLGRLFEGEAVYMSQFNSAGYKNAFDKCCETAAPILAGITDNAAAAEELAAEFENEFSSMRRRRAKLTIENRKLFICFYINPVFMKLRPELADELKAAWDRHIPGEQYTVADYETVAGGFNTTILGIPIRK